ncbi:hypothetical protein [Aulosira sp. FACHB-615]|uniref:hypothetical protein n=1 Tax=Aulosira sp. FACHB-615 TaxID=2692777 RepID=UPI001681E54E|nr:hypothetical protein [Aulosira sp. FACHB-615]MBD2489374.1 hypothetical protein [Aulosira sp. FACHB-615]
MVNEHDVLIQQIDAALKEWSQGDCVVGEHWFVHRFNPQHPLTSDSADIAQEGTDLSESEVQGFSVVSQTCDIVPQRSRTCKDRPFVEVVPLIKINQKFLDKIKFQGSQEQFLDEVRKCRRTQFAYIPGVAEYYLIADLDRVMTVEKAVISEWKRIPGCRNDEEIRTLGQVLARKRVRFAFPDDFNQFVRNLQQRIQSKHSKNSDEGEALRALREIRVRAEPSWNAPEVQLMFFFIRHEDQIQSQKMEWDKLRRQWLDLVPESGRFKADGIVTSLEDMTAKDYVESDLLDLDHLSS